MNLHVADRTVAVSRTQYVVKPRRHGAHTARGRPRRRRKVRVALKAGHRHLVPYQHLRIGRAMWLMARRASFKAHRRVLESERTAFIPVALEATRLVTGHDLHRSRQKRAMRVVTIHAGHRAFGKAMGVRALKLCPDRRVTLRAQFVDRLRLARHQTVPIGGVDVVARNTTHAVLRMTAIHPARASGLIAMAAQTDVVRFRRRLRGGSDDVLLVSRFSVATAGTVTGLAGLTFPLPPGVRFDSLMRILLKSFEDILMASRAGFRPGVSSLLCLAPGRGVLRGGEPRHRNHQRQKDARGAACYQAAPHSAGGVCKPNAFILHGRGRGRRRPLACDKRRSFRPAPWCSPARAKPRTPSHDNPCRRPSLEPPG